MPVEKKNSNKLLLLISHNLNLVIIIVMLLWLLVGFFIVIKPKINQANNLSDESSALLDEEFAAKERELEMINSLITKYNSLNQADLKKVGDFLPNEKDIPGIFVHADALARINDSALLMVQVYDIGEKNSGTNVPSNVGVMGIDMNMTMPNKTISSYAVYKKFLESVENNLRLFDIEHIYFSPHMANLNFKAKTYYLKNDE